MVCRPARFTLEHARKLTTREHELISFSRLENPLVKKKKIRPYDTIMMMGKKVVVAGATGSVGRLVVQTCLNDSRIEAVTALVRKQKSTEDAEKLWGASSSSSSSSKLTQIEVDFSSLDTNNESLKSAFQGMNAFITGLGLYSGKSTEPEMDKVEREYNTILANIAHEAGATRGAYLSGQGVKQPTKEGKAYAMFGRVKGRAEESLANIFNGQSECHVSVRPGAIFDRPGEPVYGAMESFMGKWPLSKLRDTKFGITAIDIAKGMVHGSLFDDTVEGNVIWENEDIKKAARRYEENLNSSN